MTLRRTLKYLCLIYLDEGELAGRSSAQREACVAEHLAFREALAASGQLISANPLAPSAGTVSVRRRDGKLLVTDGPFAETKEQLGGYFLLQMRDLNDAIRVASQIPSARHGVVEVRPVAERRGAPADGASSAPASAARAHYLCLCCCAEKQLQALSGAERDAIAGEELALDAALRQSGQLIVSHALAPLEGAATLRVRGGRLSIADAPYARGGEQIGAFLLIAAKDLDDAIRVAARVPLVRLGSVQLRAVHELAHPLTLERPT